MYGKSHMETYITICKIDSQWEFAVWTPQSPIPNIITLRVRISTYELGEHKLSVLNIS